MITHVLAGVFLAIALVFVYRSFYKMRIGSDTAAPKPTSQAVAA
jgi:preprotein translocase subunit SecG